MKDPSPTPSPSLPPGCLRPPAGCPTPAAKGGAETSHFVSQQRPWPCGLSSLEFMHPAQDIVGMENYLVQYFYPSRKLCCRAPRVKSLGQQSSFAYYCERQMLTKTELFSPAQLPLWPLFSSGTSGRENRPLSPSRLVRVPVSPSWIGSSLLCNTFWT